jgi:short-subunit dehydrogenase
LTPRTRRTIDREPRLHTTRKVMEKMRTDGIRGRWSLVTGASSGLGVDFARELAKRGAHLILVARREERLESVADELNRRHGVEVQVMPIDLGAQGALDSLYERVTDRGIEVDLLVNNAGFGLYGHFLETSWERELTMMQVDIVALVHLTKLVTPGMVERGYGRILQVASTAAYQPVPQYAVYGAAKAFVLSFGEALAYELKGTGVTCTVVSPGVTETEFHKVAGHSYTAYMRRVRMTSGEVARLGIEAMLRGRSSVVTGFPNALGVWCERFLPRRLVTSLAGLFMAVRN